MEGDSDGHRDRRAEAVNATTRVSILRGTTENEYGDPVDNDTPAATGVPASIVEQSREVTDPTTGTPRVVRFLVGRFYPGTDLQPGDRVKDEQDGTVFIVDVISRPQNPVRAPDVRAELRRAGG